MDPSVLEVLKTSYKRMNQMLKEDQKVGTKVDKMQSNLVQTLFVNARRQISSTINESSSEADAQIQPQHSSGSINSHGDLSEFDASKPLKIKPPTGNQEKLSTSILIFEKSGSFKDET